MSTHHENTTLLHAGTAAQLDTELRQESCTCDLVSDNCDFCLGVAPDSKAARMARKEVENIAGRAVVMRVYSRDMTKSVFEKGMQI